MQTSSRLKRQKQVQFAVDTVALNGGKPTAFTQKLLNQYEHGEITSTQLKRAILEKYGKRNH